MRSYKRKTGCFQRSSYSCARWGYPAVEAAWVGGKADSPSVVTLKSLSISPATSTVVLGGGQQFTVTGYYSDKSQRDLTQTAKWASVQPTIATISSPGMVVTKQAGTATITAASGAVSDSATLTVSTPTLVSLTVSPASPSVPKGDTQRFAATGTFSDQSTQDVTSTVVWTTSAAGIASINGAGLATGLGVGKATITATSNSITGVDSLTVTPPVLTSIAITPAKSSVGLGNNEQLSLTGTFSDGSTQDLTSSATWKSVKPAVATITQSGLAISWSIGTTGFSAGSGGLSASGTIVVLPEAAVDYFSNAHNVNAPDGTLSLVNTSLTGDDLCAMIYVFDNSQEMNECCGCLISKEGIRTLSVDNDLTSNPLTGTTLHTGVIRVVAADPTNNPTCNAGTVAPSGLILPWATHIQYFAPGSFAVTEAGPQMSTLSSSELTDLETDCAFMQKLGSGHGVCSCGTGD